MEKNKNSNRNQGVGMNRLAQEKPLEEKWITIYVNEEKHLPYWKLVNNKGKCVIVPQTGSRSPTIHNHRGVYFYNMNHY